MVRYRAARAAKNTNKMDISDHHPSDLDGPNSLETIRFESNQSSDIFLSIIITAVPHDVNDCHSPNLLYHLFEYCGYKFAKRVNARHHIDQPDGKRVQRVEIRSF